MPIKDKIILYKDKHGKVELRADAGKDTLWASLDQIAHLFDRDKSVISRHIKNIFRESELDRNSVVAKNATTAADGKSYDVEYFNLDVILSVGYRVNSKKATKFRIWATGILRDYLVKGFSLNKRKLGISEQNLANVEEALTYLKSESQGGPLKARLSLRVFKDLMK